MVAVSSYQFELLMSPVGVMDVYQSPEGQPGTRGLGGHRDSQQHDDDDMSLCEP